MNIFKPFKLALLSIGSVILAGCATPPEVQQMSINDGIDVSAIKSKGVQFKSINVIGGGNTEFIMGSRVEKAGFQEALTQTLNKLQLLNQENGISTLNVDLKNCTAPMVGFALEVKCEFEYSLQPGPDELKKLSVESVGSANSFDGFNYYHLILRKANERSVRENIKKFLESLNSYYAKAK